MFVGVGLMFACDYFRRRRREGTAERESSDDHEADDIDIDSDMQLAAQALQNLSCSPASPKLPRE